jgi:ADP-heptose:LPS heptosyltransferase
LLAKQPHQVLAARKASSAATRENVWSFLKERPNANILVIRALGGIGDVLMTTPAVRQLKEDYPGCSITYATDRDPGSGNVYYDILKNAGFINNIVDAKLINRDRFDKYIDISSVCLKYEHSDLPIINRIDIFSKSIGNPRLKNPLPFYKVEESERAAAQHRVPQNTSLVFYHTASFDSKRTWPVLNQLQFLKLMNQRMPNIKILLSDFNNLIKNKQEYPNCLDISSLPIREKAALIERSNLFVGPDSGLLHLAGALKKKGLALFGSIPPQARINYYQGISALTVNPKLSCQYCIYKPCSINFKCMSDIRPEHLVNKIQELI